MYKQQNSDVISFYAISPVHAGSGSSTGVVDLPIQRERHTNWPHIQASGVKGAMRAHFEKFSNSIADVKDSKQQEEITNKIFGAENFEGDILPGAISVSDAKLLAFPMRSNAYPFVWITSPAVLKRALRDLEMVNLAAHDKIQSVDGTDALALAGGITGDVLLEDYEVTVSAEIELPESLKKLLSGADKLLLVSDEVFNYGVSNCTEVQTQIKIDQKTGTATDGALRYEELLPADSILYSVLMYGNTRDTSEMPAESLIQYLKNEVITTHIQMGGDETLGRGMFKIQWVKEA
ncbi:type III-B CRISPR module RAMP protein Cmr4 [Chitinivibrio alkaliphilus]|uniref:CRISPR/Cas system-associated RAMP superfamily protein Cmr4 n=1 Tax=Chitinivibrio alkaliphilus ACht1 TaxID=1313304 RepID=U7D2N6_9BACT|nr:type III-B CRISPR module RAMP protein Cmr4 [Chitinivibrio alkaliphilus]ERP30774.1 CRISPR/Cas system-associated RAMP superfamily protein Cmr4 [Chitinivibrio alkaliphilus ACht1]